MGKSFDVQSLPAGSDVRCSRKACDALAPGAGGARPQSRCGCRFFGALPSVAPASLPRRWALGRNPFGILSWDGDDDFYRAIENLWYRECDLQLCGYGESVRIRRRVAASAIDLHKV